MLRCFRPRRVRTGFTLLESAIVLAIIGIVLGAIWAASYSVYNNMKVTNTVEDLIVFTQNLRKIYRGQSRFDKAANTDITEALVKLDIFPASMIDTDSELPMTQWHTDITVQIGEERDEFVVNYATGLPESVCRNFVGRVAGKGRASGLEKVRAGGETFSTKKQLDDLSALGLNGDCNSASFTFNLKG